MCGYISDIGHGAIYHPSMIPLGMLGPLILTWPPYKEGTKWFERRRGTLKRNTLVNVH